MLSKSKVLQWLVIVLVVQCLCSCAKNSGGSNSPATGGGTTGNGTLTDVSSTAIVTFSTVGSPTAAYTQDVSQELFVSSVASVTGIQAGQTPTHFLCPTSCQTMAGTTSLNFGTSLSVSGVAITGESNGEIDFVVISILPHSSTTIPFGSNPVGGGTPPPTNSAPTNLTPQQQLGYAVWTNSCASCHGSTPDNQYTVTQLTDSVGASGNMPQGGSKLSATDQQNIISYFNTL